MLFMKMDLAKDATYFFLGQSTYCSKLAAHCETIHRQVQVINLDPAAENFDYPIYAGQRFSFSFLTT